MSAVAQPGGCGELCVGGVVGGGAGPWETVKDTQACGQDGQSGGGRRAGVSGCGGAAGAFKGGNIFPVTCE